MAVVGRRQLFILIITYAVSGAAALVYEVLWTRLLTLQLGHSVAATSTTLAAFMGGLAVGSWMAGRYLGRGPRDPLPLLRIYAWLEIVVATIGLVAPLMLAAASPLLTWAYRDATAPVGFALARITLSGLVVGVPAAAMGATFPVAAGVLSRSGGAALLYTVNTFGAALGAVGAGFVLVPLLGLRWTTAVAIALNLLAASAAWRLSRRWQDGSESRRSGHGQPKPGAAADAVSDFGRTEFAARWACGIAAVSGFVALVQEIAWTRLLALLLGPTTYAFATMTAAFITGLAIGSACGTRLAQRSRNPVAWLAPAFAAGGLAAVATAWIAASRVPLIVASQVAGASVTFTRVAVVEAGLVAALLLPMTVAIGMAFPLVLTAAASRRSDLGRVSGLVYSANTVGAIAGALAGGFVLLPRLGLQGTFAAVSGVAVVAGAWCFVLARPARHLVPSLAGASAIALAGLGAITWCPPWDRDLLASGAYKYAPYVAGLTSAASLDVLRAGKLEYYKEGAAGTVSVRRLGGTLSLSIDGKVDASTGGDMVTQRLLGLLPMLLHGQADDVCVIGLGSGVTVGSVLAASTATHVDVVEISPEVVQASHCFDRENRGALASDRVRLVVGDGRSHLLYTLRQYDVIISEPSNPWMAGVASLFTREFFEAARGRLRPGGLLCQWAHTYDISAGDLKSIVRTFTAVFPESAMWLVGDGDLLLIGANTGRIEPRLEALRGRFELLSLFAAGPPELAAYAGAGAIQTDDRMALEFSGPRSLYSRGVNENAIALRALARTMAPPRPLQQALRAATDADWARRGELHIEAEAPDLAFDDYRHAIATNPRNETALSGLSLAAAGAHRQVEARQWLQSFTLAHPDNTLIRIELSRLLAGAGDLNEAAAAAAYALRLAPDDPRSGEQMASVLADAHDADRLAALADALASRFPDRSAPRYYRAAALFLHGRFDDAETEARRLVAAAPADARAQNLLGAACASAGRRDCAEAAFAASIAANPRDPSAYINLGNSYLEGGRASAAVGVFGEALSIDPGSTAASDGLAKAQAVVRE